MDHRAAAHAHPAFWDDESHLPGHVDIEVTAAAGSVLTLRSGKRLIDAASGHSCVNLGYANEELIEAAAQSYQRLAYCSPEHRCRPVAELSERLRDLLGGFHRLRYATTGGGANELAIEIARRHWRHRGRAGKRHILALDRAYHGSTGAASYASGPGILQSPHADRSDEFDHLPGARDPEAGLSRDLTTLEAALSARIAAVGSDRIAALIVEPVAFAGGVVVPPPGTLATIAGLCRRHDVLLIVDEVITGFGRSGRWFAHQWDETVRPDIVTMAKGITSAYFPLAAAAVSEEIHESFRTPGNAMSKIITMAGHPVGCDIALKVIEIMARDGLVERVRRNADGVLARLSALIDAPGVRHVRGLGHMWGIEYDGGRAGGTPATERVAARCFDAGVLVLQADNLIRINPPLTATDGELAQIVETLSAAVRAR